MAHPVHWPKKFFFYPIGNTSPVCLTQELSPEQDANILLVGCGDCRSILYTVHHDLAPRYRNLDITCCDWEPAVLARNILLLTMSADGIAPATAWAIFYHFFLDQSAYNILLAQCRTLVQVSIDMKSWKISKYGHYLRFCTDQSLAEVRRNWILYLETENLTETGRKSMQNSVMASILSVRNKKVRGVMKSPRAAGPLFLSLLDECGKLYETYWSTGVVDPDGSQVLPYANPTFIYSLSGSQFNVHGGTHPLMSFHLAPALASAKHSKTSSISTIKRLVFCAKDQFDSWYMSFRTRVAVGSSANLVIRFFVGESLAFCRALQRCKEMKSMETGIYAYPWGGTQIHFDAEDYTHSASRSAPLSFNVIDTSNLTDHIGLINILLVTVPLLQRKPWTVLLTNTLVQPVYGEASALTDLTCGDVPTIALLLGIAPSAYLSHFTTHSNKHEVLMSMLAQGPNFEQLISWKFPHFVFANPNTAVPQLDQQPVTLVCDAKKLAQFLISIYLKMFEDENFLLLLNDHSLESVNKRINVHYLRESLAALFEFVRKRAAVDWAQLRSIFLNSLIGDRVLLMGSNNYQDLLCQLSLRNVLGEAHDCPLTRLATLHKPHGCFKGWATVPPVVCVVLKVPRLRLKVLEDMQADEIGVPILQCESQGVNFHNIHPSIRPIFGDITVSRANSEPQVVINEDLRGWKGDSPLIVTFYISSWTLVLDPPESLRIGFHIRSTPSTVHKIMPKLGSTFTIYSTNLTDTEHIQIVRHRPDNPEEYPSLRTSSGQATLLDVNPGQNVVAHFDGSGCKVGMLTIRDNVTDTEAAKSLAKGANVSVVPVADSTVLVSFKEYRKHFVFPFPIFIRQIKTKIARKSSYIEIDAYVRPNYNDFLDPSLNSFSIARHDSQINLINMHYLDLGNIPSLDLLSNQQKFQWLYTHLATSLSNPENQTRTKSTQGSHGALREVQSTITSIFEHFASNKSKERNPYCLFNPNDEVGMYAFIYVNDMKLDLSSQTIVLDACLIPLYSGMPDRGHILEWIADCNPNRIITCNDETRAWMLLLPALAERCRTWKHFESCDYLITAIPASLGKQECSPLCSCGKGHNLGLFATLSKWKVLHKEATRVAISPLFAFSFMEKTNAWPMNRNTSMSSKIQDNISLSSSGCTNCDGPGKPKILLCGRCKRVKYCSSECQKKHWKEHKGHCAIR
ncbi:hypothetical protein CVT25_003902 [Psilocybe cyanescens]|uniref:MYND-type domain-containing protein n=1 Tax=Psilocybe cyanescens TaxID=93625 RepID=A0A409XQ02_PSICY|nr:hypothetical protein CVT25_003902 [Psilocybe cyanescens]